MAKLITRRAKTIEVKIDTVNTKTRAMETLDFEVEFGLTASQTKKELEKHCFDKGVVYISHTEGKIKSQLYAMNTADFMSLAFPVDEKGKPIPVENLEDNEEQ